MQNNQVMVAMSGGVDSTVAAALLKQQGFQVKGAMMRLYQPEKQGKQVEKSCGSSKDLQDAQKAADFLQIDFSIYDFHEAFCQYVIDPFVESYFRGETPNPCMICNRKMKFGAFLQRAQLMECSYMATGHYARIEYDPTAQRHLIRKAVDTTKDQTYMLSVLSQQQLAHILLPLGGLLKTQVRELAQQMDLAIAAKPDSQDICFVPDGDYTVFLQRYRDRSLIPGNFVDAQGTILGQHKGVGCYTIGQRKGLGIALGHPAFVIDKDASSNTVTLGTSEDLMRKRVFIREVNYIPFEKLHAPMAVSAVCRYHQKEQSAILHPLGDNTALLEFESSQRAPAPGQTAVFYHGDYVVGSGIIDYTQP